MVCSPEQLASNRRNSQKSTGPKTPEGKAKSRRNGLKHGLTGAGIVIPDEDAAAVQERIDAFQADLKPANNVARFLANHAALLSVRIERSAREEAARISVDMIEAEEVEEDARADEFDRLTVGLVDHPAESVRKLRRSEEGIDWLIAAWRKAKFDLLEVGGYHWKDETALRLLGLDPRSPRAEVSRVASLSLALRGKFHRLEATDWPDLPDQERRAAARAELAAIIDGEIAGLEESRKQLDSAAIARHRAGAAARAIFDASKGATLARKYEAAAERGFYRALKQIEAINAAVEAEVEENPETEETCDDLASSFPASEDEVARDAGEWSVAGSRWSERQEAVPGSLMDHPTWTTDR